MIKDLFLKFVKKSKARRKFDKKKCYIFELRIFLFELRKEKELNLGKKNILNKKI